MTNAFTPERLATIASELTSKTGRTWSVLAAASDEDRAHHELRAEPLRIGLLPLWSGKGKTHAYADMIDKDPPGYSRDHHNHKAPSIDFSTEKDAAKIAGDIARRLVPDADAWVAHELERRAQYTGGVALLDDVGAAVARAWNMPAPRAREYERLDRQRQLSTADYRLSAKVSYGGGVTFEFRTHGAEAAARVARILNELAAELAPAGEERES